MRNAPTLLAAIGGIVFGAMPANAETRDFDLPEFDRIDVSAGVMIIADVGDAQSVKVETKHGDFRLYTRCLTVDIHVDP